MQIRKALKSAWFRMLGKDPEAVVVCFATGDEALSQRMIEEVRQLVPDRRHDVVSLEPGSAWQLYRNLRRQFRGLRIGLAPVLFTPDRAFTPLRRAAFLLAPRKILAYNPALERHHLRLSTWIASWLFLRGVPVDRIYLRPWWLWPWKKDRSVFPGHHRVLEGRPLSPLSRRIAVLSPYFPYPLSHGGAVRIFYMLRELAREFDVFLFAISEQSAAGLWPADADLAPVLEFCSRVILLPRARYREPRWSSLNPPEVEESRSPAMRALLDEFRRKYRIEALQVEYTQMATYGGDVLVEHDITFDLFRQVRQRERSLSAWWNYWRWSRFECRAIRQFPRVVVMSDKDSDLAVGQVPDLPARPEVIPNGVDLDRFRPEPESPGQRLLFIGSFRHFPNVVAYRFFTEQVWPLLRGRFPEMRLTVVAGEQPFLYWRGEPSSDDRIRFLELVREVRPLYVEANLVIVPTMVSAGTNLKVLEAMAMERAVVSTSSGCAGLGLEHGVSVWIADEAQAFADGIAHLIADPELRCRIAGAARVLAERNFDWRQLGTRNRRLLRDVIVSSSKIRIRTAGTEDLAAIARLQEACREGASWEPEAYLAYDCRVATVDGRVAGLLAAHAIAQDQWEILNLAVNPAFRRRGIATQLLRELVHWSPGEIFLEVRESNAAARNLYKKLGFSEIDIRHAYYQNPPEAAVVMRLRSC